MSDIALTAAQRSSLLSLRTTQSLSDRTQTRLSTGKQVSSVVDDAVSFFKSKALSDRAADFESRKGDIDQAISSVNAALGALDAIDSLMKQLKGVAEAARSQTTAERLASKTQFNEIGKQIFQLVEDASYQGLNLLSATTSTLDVSFGVRTASKLKVSGLDLNSSGTNTNSGIFSVATFSTGGANLSMTVFGLSGGSFTSFGANNSNVSQATAMIQILDSSITRIRAHSSKLGSNVAILQTRLDFTESYTNTLTVGSDKLTLADLNEEGANLVALQTRQQLGIQSLSISGQQQQAILALIQ